GRDLLVAVADLADSLRATPLRDTDARAPARELPYVFQRERLGELLEVPFGLRRASPSRLRACGSATAARPARPPPPSSLPPWPSSCARRRAAEQRGLEDPLLADQFGELRSREADFARQRIQRALRGGASPPYDRQRARRHLSPSLLLSRHALSSSRWPHPG